MRKALLLKAKLDEARRVAQSLDVRLLVAERDLATLRAHRVRAQAVAEVLAWVLSDDDPAPGPALPAESN